MPNQLRRLASFYAPAICNGGGGAYSITIFRTYVLTYIHTYVRPLRTKKGFRAISFEYIGALDPYFIHMYIIIKYSSSLITDEIH